MPNGNIMEMMGYEAGGLPELFGQYFQDVDPRWTEMFAPRFEDTRTALGELPGLRGGMIGQLRGGLQERGIAATRGLQAQRAGAGFAGAGALDRTGRTARRGLEQEYGRGIYGIGQDIERRRAGLLGGLRDEIGGFLGQLMAAELEPASEGVTYDSGQSGIPSTGRPGYQGEDVDYGNWRDYRSEGGSLGYQDWIGAGRPEW